MPSIDKETRKKNVLEELIFMEIGTGHSIEEAAKFFGRNEKTIRVHMKNIGKILGPRYEERAKLVKKRNYSRGNSMPGKNRGKKPLSISDEEILVITDAIVYDGLTLRGAEKIFGYPKSTIKDNITRERVGDEKYELYSATAEFNSTHINQDVESPIVIEHRKKC